MSLCRNNLGTCGLRYTGASVWNNILSVNINPNVSEFILFSRVCAHSTSRTRFSSIHSVYGPHSTSRAFLSFIHVVCMAPIQPAVPSSLPSMLCVWPPFNQPCLPFFHLCYVYGPHSTSRAFLSFIHVVCMAPIQLAAPSSLSSMGVGGAVRFLVVGTIGQRERPPRGQLWMEQCLTSLKYWPI